MGKTEAQGDLLLNRRYALMNTVKREYTSNIATERREVL